MKRNGVFISYSKKDKKWLDYLRTHLKYLERKYDFSIWEDSKIEVGADWRNEIKKAIDTAKVAILMVSANFISSDFINNEELPALLAAAEEEGAYIFPIIISHCMFLDIDSISKFQTVNSPSDPLIDMNEGRRDALFLRITKEIDRVLSLADSVDKEKITESNDQNPLHDLYLSMARVSILILFYKNINGNGLSISEIHKQSSITKRKDIVSIIFEMQQAEVIDKTKIDNVNHFRLNRNGIKLIEPHQQILF